MKKILLSSLFFLLVLSHGFAADGVIGFWKTIDEHSGKARSVVAIYGFNGKYYGRIIGTYDDNGNIKDSIYDPKERAPGVIGNPYYSGLDIIWDLKSDGQKYTNGEILDPQKGRIYGAELWNKDGKLVVRGKILFFGRNQTWIPVADNEFNDKFKKPDLYSFVPSIPRVR